jgi:hypothetical protein
MKYNHEKMTFFLKFSKKGVILSMITLSMVIIGCKGETMKTESHPLMSMNEISMPAWQKLSQKRIYFGHQSVGNNMMDGVAKIIESKKDIKLNIVKLSDNKSFDQPVFAHEEVGKNEWPLTKTTAFHNRIENGLGDKIDIAFLKFCFWDIRSKTDIQEVFKNYKETISTLQAKYPRIKFIHFTVPLMSYPTGVNAGIRRMLHIPVARDMDNIKRNELNSLIRQEYAGKEPLFDIASIESTLPDGSHTFFSDHGKNYEYLVEEYTSDGGHLNPEGRKRVAEQLLIILAHVAETL